MDSESRIPDHSEITMTADRDQPEERSAWFETGLTRREFLEAAAAAAVFAGIGGQAHAAETRNGIPYRTLGRTVEKVSVVGIGGSHIGVQAEEQESIRIIRTALDSGINFLDNSWDYHGGASEERMGRALAGGYRERAFLMTKIDAFQRFLEHRLEPLEQARRTVEQAQEDSHDPVLPSSSE